MADDNEGRSAEKPGLLSSGKAWVGLIVAILAIPAAIYGAVQNWGKLFPPGPSLAFAKCNNKNLTLTLYNRRESRATIQKVSFALTTANQTIPLKMNATLDDPLASGGAVGPKGQKELP